MVRVWLQTVPGRKYELGTFKTRTEANRLIDIRLMVSPSMATLGFKVEDSSKVFVTGEVENRDYQEKIWSGPEIDPGKASNPPNRKPKLNWTVELSGPLGKQQFRPTAHPIIGITGSVNRYPP